MLWIDEEGQFESSAPVSYFTPWIDRQKCLLSTESFEMLLHDVASAIENSINGRIYLQSTHPYAEEAVTTCFIPEIRGSLSFMEEIVNGTDNLRISVYLEYDTDYEQTTQRIISQLNTLGFH
jgi:hypothetical protein